MRGGVAPARRRIDEAAKTVRQLRSPGARVRKSRAAYRVLTSAPFLMSSQARRHNQNANTPCEEAFFCGCLRVHWHWHDVRGAAGRDMERCLLVPGRHINIRSRFEEHI